MTDKPGRSQILTDKEERFRLKADNFNFVASRQADGLKQM
jgi:hypothetical protein